jgi:ferredoxin-NADP reductase
MILVTKGSGRSKAIATKETSKALCSIRDEERILVKSKMKAILTSKKEIAKGTLMVEFELLEGKVDFKPGQFFMLELLNPPYNDEKGNKRMFSIVNSPNEKDVIIMATRLSDSAFKTSLKFLPTGAEVMIDNIAGTFNMPKDKKVPVVLIAGGIGITPFISMLRYISEQKLNYKITLLYSNTDKKSTAFYDELKATEQKNKNLKVVFTMINDPEWQGENRMIDPQFIKDYVHNPHSRTYMVSGPPAMVQAVVKVLKAVGADDENIITDNFAGY